MSPELERFFTACRACAAARSEYERASEIAGDALRRFEEAKAAKTRALWELEGAVEHGEVGA